MCVIFRYSQKHEDHTKNNLDGDLMKTIEKKAQRRNKKSKSRSHSWKYIFFKVPRSKMLLKV